jgi:hypothetical protein
VTTHQLVAWRVTARGHPDAGIYGAATAARALVLALMAAFDAGYMVAWMDMTARRAPEFDGWVARQGREQGWNEEYAARCVAEDEAGRVGPRLSGPLTDAP